MEKVTGFLKEAWAELKKATWLSRKEVGHSTVLVVVFVVLIAAYINVIDYGLTQVLKSFVGGR